MSSIAEAEKSTDYDEGDGDESDSRFYTPDVDGSIAEVNILCSNVNGNMLSESKYNVIKILIAFR